MILLLALIFGLFASLIRAWMGGRRLAPPDLRLTWLTLVAFLPQWIVFYLPPTRELLADHLVALALTGSQVLLLVFAWFNRRQPGFWALGLGLALNLLVIILNGGLMPISPEMAARLMPEAPLDAWQVGSRLGATKDIILPVPETRLWWLSDRFLLSAWSYRVAFSLGDAFIAGGAFWLLWTLSRAQQVVRQEIIQEAI